MPTAHASSLDALRRFLAQRRDALQQEVRDYPTPIARCDEQLPKVIERRGRAIEQLRLAEAAAAGDAAALDALLRAAALDPDDPEEKGVRSVLQRAKNESDPD